MAHSVTAPDAAAESLLRLVAEAGGLQHLNVTIDATSSDVRFTAADGTPAFGAATACRWLASLGSAAAQLLGETPEQAAKVRWGVPNWGLTAAAGRTAAGERWQRQRCRQPCASSKLKHVFSCADCGVDQLPQRAAATDGPAAGRAE